MTDGGSMLVLREEPFDGAAAESLITALQMEYVDRYGGPDTAPVDPTEFAPPHGRFVVGYVDNEPVSCGGFRRLAPDRVELKRMYVVPRLRGNGLSRQVLAHLEQLARDVGAVKVLLETGHKQPEAMSLYESSGYERVEGFGHYACEPLSVSYGKNL